MTTDKPLTVAIQGEQGAFSHQAAIAALGPGIEVLPRATFDALFDSVVEGQADRALVPIENSLHGSIHENYDRLKSRPLHIVGETQLRICAVPDRPARARRWRRSGAWPRTRWPSRSAGASSPSGRRSRR